LGIDLLILCAGARASTAGSSSVQRVSEDNDAAATYALALNEAGRALDGQERSVNELRSRAGVLIAAAAITTSCFGARAVTHDLSVAAWFAVVAFALTDVPASLPRIHRDLALHGSASYDRNAQQLGVLFTAFGVGLVMLVIEVGACMIALSEQG
jgi:hypothetical protein